MRQSKQYDLLKYPLFGMGNQIDLHWDVSHIILNGVFLDIIWLFYFIFYFIPVV